MPAESQDKIIIPYEVVEESVSIIITNYSVSKKVNIIILKGILIDCVNQTNEYLIKYYPNHNPNIFKQAGSLCFYIRKYKPLVGFIMENEGTPKQNDLYTNEIIGWYVGLLLISSYYERISKGEKRRELNNKLDYIRKSKFINPLLRNLREGSFSPTSITFIYWALFIDNLLIEE
ncbi:MAG: hypothetical protein HPY53_02520 [Brevinematales bacterium]|nr:hypothetical protein [Brevinematales bacterium]